MNKDIIIRQEEEKDYRQVESMVRLAFRDMEESDHMEHLLVRRLRLSKAFVPPLSLVAETREEQIVGHVLVSKVRIVSEQDEKTVLSMAPLSVRPGFQRQGIGGMLIRRAHEETLRLGHKAIVLLGHADYYTQFGYRKASGFGIHFPFEAPDECCLAIELEEGGLRDVTGMVRYPAAFGLE